STLDFSLLKRGYVEPPPPKQLPAGRRQDRGDPLPARNPANSWPVLQPWPTFDSGLNESQLQAVRQALTNELALIQGPPGTGKTFVGLKIARLLLQTRQRTAPPILCVCYTNHALDQFLEGIYKFEKDVVRIGGRSSSTILGERNIMKLQLPYGHRLLGARWNIKRSCVDPSPRLVLPVTRFLTVMVYRQDEVSHAIVQCLENLRKERLSLSDLKKVAFPHHLRSLGG
ncbi:DNAbinding protein smubp-2, putative, partial [Acanthamoeba castellanii str. Neff]